MSGYTGGMPPEKFNLARYCLAASARRSPDKTALIVVDGDIDALRPRSWSYREIEDLVLRLAALLAASGLARGDRVLVRMKNSADYAFFFLAANAAGLVPIPASDQLTAPEIARLIDDAGPAAILRSPGMPLPAAANDSVVLDPCDLIARAAGREPAPYARTLRDDPAFLVYTSGTSGAPKGVLHAQRAVWGRRPMYRGWYGLGEDDIMLHTGAFNWTYTIGAGLLDPWANGATSLLYVGEKNPAVWAHVAKRFGATIMAGVPMLYRQILKYGDLALLTSSPLRHALVAGEALPLLLAHEWHRKTGLGLYEALGMSEISTYISSSPDVPVRPGSPGRPQEGRCIAILPIAGGDTPLPAGETGLLAVHRGDPGLMLGYWNAGSSDARVFRGDWFCGGDLAMLDEDGYVWFKGRNDDVLTVMGYRVSPQEVETALRAHALVAEVAVAGLKVGGDVTVIAAFVVCAASRKPDRAALEKHAASLLAPYKRPREYVFLEKLPRSANGKVDRGALSASHQTIPAAPSS